VRVSTCAIDDLRTIVQSKPGTLYAVLDACDEPRVPEKVRELGDRAVSLYRGHAERDYWAIAPYLAQADGALLDWVVENLWNDPWGILAAAPVDLPALRKHFRRFLTVRNPAGKPMYFRFYDPRVLPTFLSTCTPEEAAEFFGAIQGFFVPGKGERVLRISRAPAGAPQ